MRNEVVTNGIIALVAAGLMVTSFCVSGLTREVNKLRFELEQVRDNQITYSLDTDERIDNLSEDFDARYGEAHLLYKYLEAIINDK